jgi:hypothetical protein
MKTKKWGLSLVECVRTLYITMYMPRGGGGAIRDHII